jgi:hypothetical protein
MAVSAVVAPLPARADSGVIVSATVNQTTLDHRVRLAPGQPATVAVTVINNTDQILAVRSVEIRGSALGLTFYSAGTVLDLQVPARQTSSWTVQVDVDDLGSQATGLLPLQVALIGEHRHPIAAVDGTADLRGSVWSAYGLFGLGLLATTIAAWATALLALARGRLPRSRLLRGARFTFGGLGLGLVAVISFSVLRVIAPSASSELAFVLGTGFAAFVLGFLTPRPADPRPPAGDEGDATVHGRRRVAQQRADDRLTTFGGRYPDAGWPADGAAAPEPGAAPGPGAGGPYGESPPGPGWFGADHRRAGDAWS